MKLKDAHDQVTELEADMRRELPEIADIVTHIESEPSTIETPEEVVSDAKLEKRLKAVATHFPEVLDVHDFVIKRVRGRMYISCHCTMPDDLSLARVHDIQTELEIRFKQHAPELFRVLIHPEPSTDNRR
jgi:divalent metal cation (Fe/Co/Zn/Cd) transporter